MINMDKFVEFVDYLNRETRDDFYIDLKEIEKIIDSELSNSAYQYPAYWSADGVHRFATLILECGFKVRPDLKNKRIRLIRVNTSSIEITKMNIIRNMDKPVRYNTEEQKVDLFKYVSRFINIYQTDDRGRYLSYDHIRKAFLEYRNDISKRDLLTLNLYAYLASWGMLRNSFLIQKDYKFLTPVVDILCNTKYESLINYDPFIDEGREKPELIMELAKEIKRYFLGKTYYPEGNDNRKTIKSVSATLITKILLGTLGCTVAYDTYVKKGLSHHKLTQTINLSSLYELRKFAKTNKEEIMLLLSKLNEYYTPMKIIDMYLFELGFSL